MKRISQLTVLVLVSGAAAMAAAARAPAPVESRQVVTPAEQSFMEQITRSAAAEAVASAMELKNTKNPAMQAYARHLLRDSSEIAQSLKPLAASKRISLPAEMTEDDRQQLQKMQGLDPSNMDRRYAERFGADAQRKMLDRFEKTASDAADPDIQAFAARYVPRLKNDLEASQRLPVA